MVSAATALSWSQTINQRVAAIDSGNGNDNCGDYGDGDRDGSSNGGDGGTNSGRGGADSGRGSGRCGCEIAGISLCQPMTLTHHQANYSTLPVAEGST
jgi:hypothetical protein